ncbi:hypothetical protein GALMADRAFT_74889 [Galerina marginata CBS 339.88]|uniref:Wax synthase domain-containing protein n=1 Tax=Galerina marginata (strain CBS 339.88) TaxID=685588 RepID=A0A067SN31_GALM3|nr:hypothetical protein GALMADRAFT_74889 [Galerina marginata CBS 339.88]
MFLIRAVSLFCITNGAALAAPLVDTPVFSSTQVSDLLPAVSTNQRSTWDIFWSCVATIFACTWVSIHPNMPSPKDGRIQIVLQRLELMLWAVMAPGMIIFWAIRQWQHARAYATKYRKYGWTITHGHFLQMGGFVLADGDHDISVLTPSEFNQLLARKEIGFPLISEKEIQDRSKSDGLSSALVVGQTSWFIVQCISRKVQGLTITEIELVTLAFAFLNGIMYFLWWNKPVDVTTCVRIYRLTGAIPHPQAIDLTNDEDSVITATMSVIVSMHMPLSQITAPPMAHPPPIDSSSSIHISLERESRHSLSSSSQRASLSFSSQGRAFLRDYLVVNPVAQLSKYLILAVLFILNRLREIRGELNPASWTEPTRIPTFFPPGGDSNLAYGSHFSISIISIISGLIHCLGWSLTFLSGAEKITWRVSALIISAVPILGLFLHCFLHVFNFVGKFLRKDLWWIFVGIVPIYLLARIALLVVAFLSLRKLPSGAYSVVNWTEYLPHI